MASDFPLRLSIISLLSSVLSVSFFSLSLFFISLSSVLFFSVCHFPSFCLSFFSFCLSFFSVHNPFRSVFLSVILSLCQFFFLSVILFFLSVHRSFPSFCLSFIFLTVIIFLSIFLFSLSFSLSASHLIAVCSWSWQRAAYVTLRRVFADTYMWKRIGMKPWTENLMFRDYFILMRVSFSTRSPQAPQMWPVLSEGSVKAECRECGPQLVRRYRLSWTAPTHIPCSLPVCLAPSHCFSHAALLQAAIPWCSPSMYSFTLID